MNEPLKKLTLGILALVLAAVGAVWLLTDGPTHIQDTNGPDNYSLTVITDEDIIENRMGALNFTRSTRFLNDMVIFHSHKFTGVKEIMWTNVVYSTGVTLHIVDFQVNAGNFKMAVINNGEIIREIQPGEDIIDLGPLQGYVSLVVAGESADFSFRIFRHDYDTYSHRD